MPRRTRPSAAVGEVRASRRDAAPEGPLDHRRAAVAVGGRVLERLRETIDSVARQMGARRRNLDRLGRGR